MFANLLQAFAHQANTRSQSIAIWAQRNGKCVPLTWGELAVLVDGVASNIDAQRIGFCSDNSLPDVVLPLACMAAGAIEVPIDHRLGDSVSQLWEQVGGRWLTSDDRDVLLGNVDDSTDVGACMGRLAQAAKRIDENQPALILWTSGTTSIPRGVTLSHRNLVGNAYAKLTAVPQTLDDVRLTTLPLCHAYARTCDYATWLLSGCTLGVGLGFQAWQRLGAPLRPTLCNTVPSIARRLLSAERSRYGEDDLRLLGCGGAAMSDADFEAWSDRGVTVIQGYGLTESSPVICSATPENATAGLVGRFVEGWEHEIRHGRLYVRGPHVMLGYWNDEHSTRERIDEEGWLDTSDLVEVDTATGQLRILGRADDVIVLSNGHKIHPQSIEKEIEVVDGVSHAMIVGVGQRIEVWIDVDDSLHTRSLAEQVVKSVAHRPEWERPQRVHRFKTRLSLDDGELTSKDVVRRQRIRTTRAREFER